MPGSPLACLDAMAGDAVEGSCERTLFATPEAMAAAVSYVAAQVSLFADVSDVRQSRQFRAGAAAGELAARDRDRPLRAGRPCAGDARRLHDRSMPRIGADAATRSGVNTNLSQRTYDLYVARHSAASGRRRRRDQCERRSAAIPVCPARSRRWRRTSTAGAARNPRPDLFFPSSDSIPPVNIMTAEPAGPPETTGSTPPARTPPRRPQRRRSRSSAAQATGADRSQCGRARRAAGAAIIPFPEDNRACAGHVRRLR